jgi:choline dehydrogenase-like flavoprotein
MDFDAIVIGSGFGGTVATTQLVGAGKRVLVIERGAWWVSPIGLARPPMTPSGMTMRKWLETTRKEALRKQGRTSTDHLLNFWPRPDHFRGLFDLIASIRTRWNPDGLYSYRRFEEAHIPTANGVGGGSLIYSNVTIRPNQTVLERIGLNLGDAEYGAATSWMKQYRGPTNQIVTKSPPFPGDGLHLDVANLDQAHEYLYLDKSLALKASAPQAEQELGLKLPWQPLDLSIVDYDPTRTAKAPDGTEVPASDADKAHTYCQRQGRCLFGCLPQARHTLNKTLWGKVLTNPQFANLVELRELAEVSLVSRVDGGYEVTYRDRMADGREVRVRAPKLFLAAGTLGTTELLLRCANAGTLPLSDRVGHDFSTNGDFGGFAVGTQMKVHSTQGPINTCHLDVELADGSRVTVEDSGLPAMVAELARYSLHILELYLDANRRWRKWWFKLRMRLFWHVGRRLHLRSPRLPHFIPRATRLRRRAQTSMVQQGGDPASPATPQPPGKFPWPSLDFIPNTTDPARYQTEAEMVEDIFFFNTMGQDAANGVFRLKRGLLERLLRRPGKLDLTWDEPVSRQAVFADAERIQKALATAMGGKYLPMPFWDGFTEKKLVIPHPLGGCRLAASREQGVVDEHGRVFDGAAVDPTATLPGLYIVDGSVIPGALAVNPTLTITAQALKTVGAALKD